MVGQWGGVVEVSASVAVNAVYRWQCFLIAQGQKDLLPFAWVQLIKDIVSMLLPTPEHTGNAQADGPFLSFFIFQHLCDLPFPE